MRSARPRVQIFLVVVAFACLSAVPMCIATSCDASSEFKVTILHMNDPHAHYDSYRISKDGEPIGGFAKAKTVMDGVEARNRAEGKDTLKLMAGDLLMGTLYSTAFKGDVGVRLMNKMGFDAMVVGNHEFDYGNENLLRIRKMMNFPLLSANIRTAEEKHPFQRVITKTLPVSGALVVIFGLTTHQTPTATLPDNVKGLQFDDPIETAKKILEPFDDADFIIALTHIGLEEDERLAAACPKIDVIIGGHTHTYVDPPRKVGNTIVCQASAYARYVGRLDLDVKNGRVVAHQGQLTDLTEKTAEDPKLSSIMDEYRKPLEKAMKVKVGETRIFLDGRLSSVRSGHESNLGRLIAYTAAESCGADVAIINGGGIRSSINEGTITLGDVHTVLPFGNTVVKLDMTGEDLLAVLQRSADLKEGSGGKLQTYGTEFTNNGGKVTIERIRGRSFAPTDTYSVAINNFLLAGGDGYNDFKDKGNNARNTYSLLADLLVDFFKKHQVVTQQTLESVN
jgi:5'-nucleotidase / UDP-sugar diphosphatase